MDSEYNVISFIQNLKKDIFMIYKKMI